jgi:hypothetical protein
MRSISKACLLAIFLQASCSLFAQKDRDSIRLACPFEHGSGREPKEAYTWQPRDEKIIMISRVDTIVRSCINGTVSNVNATEDGKYEIVIYKNYFYFWYYGVAKPLVKKGDNVAARTAIGTYTFGTELEFRMFRNEDQLDPRNLLECKVPRAND